ncbi:LuxR C-terminal-related transcriptional regulator [Lacinutrix sp. C3R15]|uniref:helix-turn-helix transcriptional regulator n=1 Tax=Flavobacteriaceae TaxID=49546 RepID=UPI001C09D723|nr:MULTISPECIES: LuxR C-terminal-related transcriptional regulator [Flavobacteriaceae]MBU2940378.1 LuxR C-terminal-related transcriptional regulator [Lacinutrix sp. C3R15]MDO6623698.1 LuxR C-terminal-related transcriptional regulator [Oceanihabitans sp. 1_MG-2023]
MFNCYLKGIFYYFVFSLSIFCSFAQSSNNEFLKYIDSAWTIIDENPKLAKAYLDSITEPVDKKIEGRLAEYYQLKGLVNDGLHEQALIIHNFMQALKYAKKEKNYDVAGMSSLELFYNTYLVKKDSVLAFRYLNEAQKYYSLSNNINGLAEVKQMPAYVALNNKKHHKSNAIILKDLEYYKNITDDAYYYMYALFMLTTNYIGLDDIANAHKYFNKLKKLKNNKTIPQALFNRHIVTLYGDVADFHFKNKAIDSLQLYLQKFGALRSAMNDQDTRNYFRLQLDYYDLTNDIELKNAFKDSLRNFETAQMNKTLNASIKINTDLMEAETKLEAERKKKHRNSYIIGLLVILLIAFATIVIARYKKIKAAILEYTKSDKEFSFLKTNHEKLKVKTRGLEDYIKEVKKEIKAISSINNSLEQKEKIKELYKNINLNSSTFLAKEENYLELINDLNIDFFTQMKTLHPKLNDSEITICYYLSIGFKNKEIATFLNSSTRAIESKRYRISKKMDTKTNNITLVEYLNETFK